MTATIRRFTRILTSARWKFLTAALLGFGVLVPNGSAKCFRDFSQVLHTPVISAAVNPEAAVTPRPSGIEGIPVTNVPSVNSGSIVGLWNVTFTSGGQTVDVAFDAWHSDGTEILNDYTNPIEGNVCLGVWAQTGPRTYVLRHPSWSFDTTGTLLGTVLIRETVTLSPDCNSYHGNYAYDIYDITGAFVVEYTGQISATRIKPI